MAAANNTLRVRPYASGPTTTLLERIGWARPYALAALVFAAGCGLLVPEVVANLAFGYGGLDFLHVVAFYMMLVWAWPVFLLAVAALLEDRVVVSAFHRSLALMIVVGTVAGSAAGLLIAMELFPANVAGYPGMTLGRLLVGSGYFVYIPTVFGPILAGHATLAVLLSRSCRVAAARDSFLSGAAGLFAVTGLGLFLQLIGGLGGWGLGVIGLALPGYLVLAYAAQDEDRKRMPVGSWLERRA